MKINLFLIVLFMSLVLFSSCSRRPVAYGVDPYYYYPQGIYYANHFYDPMFYSFIPRGNRIIIIDRRTERQVAAPRQSHIRPAPGTGAGRQPAPGVRQPRTPREGTVEPRPREQPAPSPRRGGTVTPEQRRETPRTTPAPQQRRETPRATPAPQQRREQPQAAPAPRSRQAQPNTRTAPAQPQQRSTQDSGTGTGGTRSRRGGN